MRAMPRSLRRAIPSYVVLLLTLAVLGAFNQRQLDRELTLMDTREELRLLVVELRADAASVHGPLAVSRWAQTQGMVPAPESEGLEHVMPLPAPALPDATNGLEVRTVWH